MKRRRLSRKAEKRAIERHLARSGLKRPDWTPTNGMPWSLSEELNWIEKTDPLYTPRVQRRPRKQDSR